MRGKEKSRPPKEMADFVAREGNHLVVAEEFANDAENQTARECDDDRERYVILSQDLAVPFGDEVRDQS